MESRQSYCSYVTKQVKYGFPGIWLFIELMPLLTDKCDMSPSCPLVAGESRRVPTDGATSNVLQERRKALPHVWVFHDATVSDGQNWNSAISDTRSFQICEVS